MSTTMLMPPIITTKTSSSTKTSTSSSTNTNMNYNNTGNNNNNNNEDERNSQSSVQVAVRIRPLLPFEGGSHTCINSAHSHRRRQSSSTCPDMIEVGGHSTKKSFLFDQAFDSNTNQKSVFIEAVSPLVNACLDGYNATVLAYGQTGSGKTFTILGPSAASSFEDDTNNNDDNQSAVSADTRKTSNHNSNNTKGNSSQAGIIPRALRDLFQKLEAIRAKSIKEHQQSDTQQQQTTLKRNQSNSSLSSLTTTHTTATTTTTENENTHPPYEYEVRVQFLELYGEEIRDLLSKSQSSTSSTSSSKLVIRDGGTNVEPDVIGAVEVKVNSAADALLCLTRGMLRRVTGATAMNSESSRSHAIMTVIVEQTTMTSSGGGADGSGEKELESKRSKFHFVDLAGSERQKRSRAEGIRLKEGIDINKGLLVLGNVISALGDIKKRGKTFVPYRDSKLTRLLKGSLGGNHKTLMIACVSPSSLNMEESLNCLRYANRAKNIQNNAVQNVDSGSKLVEQLRCQVRFLAMELLLMQKENDEGKRFSNDILKALANGNDVNVNISNLKPSNNNHSTSTSISTGTNTSNRIISGKDERQQNAEKAFLDVSKAEISILKQTVQELKNDLTNKVEQLFTVKAEAEYYRLQQSSSTSNQEEEKENGNDDDGHGNDDDDGHDGHDVQSPSTITATAGTTTTTKESKATFVNRVANYEREIANLKTELREVKIKAATTTSSTSSNHHEYDMGEDDGDESDNDNATATTSLESHSYNSDYNNTTKRKKIRRRRPSIGNGTAEALDNESKNEQKEIDRIAKKYIKLANGKGMRGNRNIEVDDDDDDDDDEHEHEHDEDEHDEDDENGEHSSSSDNEVADVGVLDMDVEESFLSRQSHLDANMMQLTKRIAAKEELIEQLKLSQSKYETMKTFYQEKLRKMTVQLREQESERHNLETELKQNEQDSQKYKDLEAALRAKEKHINHLRNRQSEIENLTSIASRNDNVIDSLKNEIVEMKQQKISLQKQLSKEKKDHEKTVKELKKKMFSHAKDANKAKQELARTLVQKQKVQDIAKSHANEVSKLRVKYREAEKKLRMQTLKRGVMERAGIDPVLVGRKVRGSSSRSFSSHNSTINSYEKKTYTSTHIHQMRSFLDDKVADISRKEANADKLAHEWEDHLELTTRKEQIMSEVKGKKDPALKDELEALDFQIEYKESRIRQLARRLASRPSTVNGENSDFLQDTLIDDRKFKEITTECSPLAGAQLSSKVLFGMVVMERRRVAKLARAASSLDQKVLDAENLAKSKEAALRSLMEESKNDRVAMAQNQQEKILSLMSLLHQDQEQKVSSDGEASSEMRDSVVLTLANERIDTLEKQLEEMQEEKTSRQNFQAREAETVAELTKITEDYGNLFDKSRQISAALAIARDKIKAPHSDLAWPDSKDRLEILKVIDDALQVIATSSTTNHPKNMSTKSQTRLMKTPLYDIHELGYRLLESDEEEESSDSAVPEWAGHIMEDLAIIAAGDVPPSLKTPAKTPRRPSSRGSVFDRLSDPDNFTGAQKSAHNDHYFNDGASVGSTRSNRSGTVRKDRASLMRAKSSNRSKSQNSTPVRSSSRSSTPLRKHNSNTPTPFRHTTPGTPKSIKSTASKGRFTSRINEILKDHANPGPPRELNIPTKDDDVSIRSVDKGFINAYTQKDVFERLQKKMTNAYTLAVQKAMSEDEERFHP